jgi:TRAP-type uncharacterized transport system fused permease subunit
MFIFYYAVLSEVSPPTALSPFAAAAITGGHPFRTMMLTWKYTLPAFVFPFAFTLTPRGLGLLMEAPLATILLTTAAAAVGVAALSAGLGGWIRSRLNAAERVCSVGAGMLLLYPERTSMLAGILMFTLVVVIHVGRVRSREPGRA